MLQWTAVLLSATVAPPAAAAAAETAAAGDCSAATSSSCEALEVVLHGTLAAKSELQRAAGYYSIAPASWRPAVSQPGSSEGGTQAAMRPVFYQKYCPNATAPSACVGAHFISHSGGHWVLARRPWTLPDGYHALAALPSAQPTPASTGSQLRWLLVTAATEVAPLPPSSIDVRVHCVPPRARPPRCRVNQATSGALAHQKRQEVPIAASFRPPGAYRVHITPGMLSAASCKAVIGLAEQYAAEHNGGWESDRHGKHATVDLAVRKYPPLLQLLQPTLDHVAGNLPPVTHQLLTTVRV